MGVEVSSMKASPEHSMEISTVLRRGRFTPHERRRVPTEQDAECRRGKFLPVQKRHPIHWWSSMHLNHYTQLLKILQLGHFIEIH